MRFQFSIFLLAFFFFCSTGSVYSLAKVKEKIEKNKIDKLFYFNIFSNIKRGVSGLTLGNLKDRGIAAFETDRNGKPYGFESMELGIGLQLFPIRKVPFLKMFGFDASTSFLIVPVNLKVDECTQFQFNPQRDCSNSIAVFPFDRSFYNLGGILKYHIYTIGKGQLTLWSGAGYHYAKGTTSSDAQLVLSSVNITIDDRIVKSWYAKLAVGFEAPLYDWMNVIFSLGVEYRNRTVDLRPSQGNVVKNDFNFTLSGGLGFF